MAEIDAQRFIDLKARVKAECLRRKYIGSVTDYGGGDYDFSNVPAEGKIVEREHYEKLAAPLAAINPDKVPGTSGERIVSETELAGFEAALTAFEARATTDTTRGDCAANCTGMCYTGCTGTCTGGCGSGCSGTCTGGCSGCSGCSGSCRGGCYGCGSGCASSCYGTCSGGCSDTCTVTCGYNGCLGQCVSSCVAQCVTGCAVACGACGNTCTAVSK